MLKEMIKIYIFPVHFPTSQSSEYLPDYLFSGPVAFTNWTYMFPFFDIIGQSFDEIVHEVLSNIYEQDVNEYLNILSDANPVVYKWK